MAAGALALALAVGVDAGDVASSVPIASHGAVALQLDWLVDLIRQVDRLLEAVVDLLETVGRLTGEGGD